MNDFDITVAIASSLGEGIQHLAIEDEGVMVWRDFGQRIWLWIESGVLRVNNYAEYDENFELADPNAFKLAVVSIKRRVNYGTSKDYSIGRGDIFRPGAPC